MRDFWRRNSPLLAALAFVVFFLVLIHTSTQTQADRVYKAATEVCARSNQTREDLDNLYLSFITHNDLTSDLFSIVGATIRADDPKVAASFTKFAAHYRDINKRYARVRPIDCETVITK